MNWGLLRGVSYSIIAILIHPMKLLEQLLGRAPEQIEIAGHIADSISAQQQLQRIAREDGDVELLLQST